MDGEFQLGQSFNNSRDFTRSSTASGSSADRSRLLTKRLSARPGETVQLSAEGSNAPDGDDLTYNWFAYHEAGSFTTAQGATGAVIRIEDANKKEACLVTPDSRLFRLGEIHVILTVTDQADPPITRCRRINVDVR